MNALVCKVLSTSSENAFNLKKKDITAQNCGYHCPKLCSTVQCALTCFKITIVADFFIRSQPEVIAA